MNPNELSLGLLCDWEVNITQANINYAQIKHRFDNMNKEETTT